MLLLPQASETKTLPAPSTATPHGPCSCPAPLPAPPMTRVGGGALPACMAPDESILVCLLKVAGFPGDLTCGRDE